MPALSYVGLLPHIQVRKLLQTSIFTWCLLRTSAQCVHVAIWHLPGLEVVPMYLLLGLGRSRVVDATFMWDSIGTYARILAETEGASSYQVSCLFRNLPGHFLGDLVAYNWQWGKRLQTNSFSMHA